ncbi:growth hormone-regulated tbc protein [Anaeramoeba flamelloides]|uniref:Growth hormone-regulated tbc protein n=1 Tax=Anaeramoeba flamelloides TaxID=1746091 RepID=A0ABQ8YU44_9EUKA|nr:growth hormone-regulated tbc protein [Anaeramoeba flamelloides]
MNYQVKLGLFDYYGFPLAYSKKQEKQIQKLAKKANKNSEKIWNKFEKKNGKVSTITEVDKTIKKLSRKGIPHQHRLTIWPILCGSKYTHDQNRGYYKRILKEHTGHLSPSTQQIEHDLARTFPMMDFFKSKENMDKLRNVLYAYSFRNPEIGYCQSMNFIVGFFLILGFTEEETFWMFVTIVEVILPKKTYSDELQDTQIDQLSFEYLLRSRYKWIRNPLDSLDEMGVKLTVITQQWFMCLFICCLPTECVLRIFDIVFAEGYKILFRVSLALFKINKAQILKCNSSPDLFTHLKNMSLDVIDPDKLINTAFSIRFLTTKEINKHREKISPNVKNEINKRQIYKKQMRKKLKQRQKGFDEKYNKNSTNEKDSNSNSNSNSTLSSKNNSDQGNENKLSKKDSKSKNELEKISQEVENENEKEKIQSSQKYQEKEEKLRKNNQEDLEKKKIEIEKEKENI